MQQYDVTSIAIFRTTSLNELGTRLYDFTPGVIEAPGPDGQPGGRVFTLDQTITVIEAADVEAGHWWVLATTPNFPAGEIRGQIIGVPEPTTNALILASIALFGISRARMVLKTPLYCIILRTVT